MHADSYLVVPFASTGSPLWRPSLTVEQQSTRDPVWLDRSLLPTVVDQSRTTSKDEFRVGDIVTDDKEAAVSALIAEVPNETAEESVVSSSDSGATVILADRYDRIPSTDSVYGLVFDPVLRRLYPNWQSDQTRTALAAYRTGSFRSAANVRPESVLARIDEDEDMYLIDPR